MVDLLWIFVYKESYLNKKREVDEKKARSNEEKKNFRKKNDELSRGYRKFFN
jgi:hypothetical protein